MELAREWLYAAAQEREVKAIQVRVKEDDIFVRGLQTLVLLIPCASV
jgi:hypothetical protein